MRRERGHPAMPDLPPFLRSGDEPACRGNDVNPDWFFPTRINAHGHDAQALRKARALCESCTLRRACRDWAVDNRIGYGVWGGLTPKQRIACRVGRCVHPEHRAERAAA